MKRSILILLSLVIGSMCYAYDFEDNGFFYNVLSQSDTDGYTVELTSDGDASYIGAVEVPEFVHYAGKDYTVVGIGDEAFFSCKKVTSITLPSTIKSFGKRSFGKCVITTLEIPDSVEVIGEQCFYQCLELKRIVIPNSVETIGNGAFSTCNNLETVTIPNSVTSIGTRVFEFCDSLSEVELGENITTITKGMFQSCGLLEQVKMKGAVTSIGENAFMGCVNLVVFDIPSTVTSIGASAFYGCSNLTGVVIPEGVTSIERQTFRECVKLSNVKLPDNFMSIGDYAFYKCSVLKSFVVPEGITVINKNTFELCFGLKYLILPSTLTSISNGAFSSCMDLKGVTMKSNNAVAVSEGVFNEAIFSTKCKLYVSEEAVEAYKTVGGWERFEIEAGAGTQCNAPEVTVVDGQLVFDCGLENANYHYNMNIVAVSQSGNTDGKVNIPFGLEVVVSATAQGHIPSETITKIIELKDFASSPAGINGDIDGDGEVNIADVTRLVNIVLGRELPSEEEEEEGEEGGDIEISDDEPADDGPVLDKGGR